MKWIYDIRHRCCPLSFSINLKQLHLWNTVTLQKCHLGRRILNATYRLRWNLLPQAFKQQSYFKQTTTIKDGGVAGEFNMPIKQNKKEKQKWIKNERKNKTRRDNKNNKTKWNTIKCHEFQEFVWAQVFTFFMNTS